MGKEKSEIILIYQINSPVSKLLVGCIVVYSFLFMPTVDNPIGHSGTPSRFVEHEVFFMPNNT